MSDIQLTKPIINPLQGLYAALEPLTLPFLRILTGLMLMPHGAQKLFGWFGGYGIDGTAGFMESIGHTPGVVFAVVVGATEFFGGMALALGLLTRPVAVAVIILMLNAIAFHLPNGYFWPNGGFEYPLLWGAVALVFAVRGGGRYSIDSLIGRAF